MRSLYSSCLDKQREPESGCSLDGRAPAALMITARGGHTFTPKERGTLQSLGTVRFHSQAEEMTADEFVDLSRPYQVVAITRRPMKHLHRDTLSRLTELKTLVVHTTGTHRIDERHLHDRGIPVGPWTLVAAPAGDDTGAMVTLRERYLTMVVLAMGSDPGVSAPGHDGRRMMRCWSGVG